VKQLRFEWDERKATVNRRKHGVSFEEARTVFFDENALLRPDEDHSEDEDRFVFARAQRAVADACRLPLLPTGRGRHSADLRP